MDWIDIVVLYAKDVALAILVLIIGWLVIKWISKWIERKVVYIPNGSLSNTGIVNYSEKDTRRVDLMFTTGYEDDSKHVLAVLNDVINQHPNTMKDPEPFVRMSEHGASAVVYTVRVWTKSDDYWTVYFDLIETVKKRFDSENISIPYPQMDIHVSQSQN